MTATMTFSVPGVHCGHCKSALEGPLASAKGVEKAEVDIAARALTVSYDHHELKAAELIEIIEDQSYNIDGFREER